MGSMDGRVAIVTGGNTGIGKETVRGLAREGATVVLACRDAAKGEAARAELEPSVGPGKIRVMPLDLADLSSVRTFAAAFGAAFGRLDVLVNNAGVWPTRRQTTRDGFELTLGTNHLGHFVLTQELLPLLKKSAPSRIVNLSSDLHYRGKMDWDDLQFERRSYSAVGAYNQSKLANVLFTNALARRLEGSGVVVNAVHPGVVTTELARGYPKLLVKLFHLFTISPEQGAKTSLHVALASETAAVSGKYFEKCREKPAALDGLSEANQERLWAWTEKALGLPA